ncbi:MAG: glycosyltransferase [Pyrinomonadaceae bacterium]|nr:glycosyltransferase [Pyrinomonadaceae bacterium]
MSDYSWRRIKKSLKRRLAERNERRNFEKWLELHGSISAEQRAEMRERIEDFTHQPLISVILPVYNVGEKWIRACIESVLDQIYENWELCIADDCSPSPHVRKILSEYAAQDKRIKVVFRDANGHISAASNSALELANGEFCALLDHDDLLSANALFYVAQEINNFPETDFIYSDEDMISEDGARHTPKFKPDFSLELLYSVNYATHLAVYRTSIVRKIGGFRVGLEGSQDYDLALRVIEQIPENHIRHIPRILYHWRAIQGSVALSGDEKPYAHERARDAIRLHLERTGKRAKVSQTVYNLHRVQYNLPTQLPKINLILLEKEDFAATATAIKTLSEATDYQNLEIVVVCSAGAKARFDVENPTRKAKIIVCEAESEAEKYNAAVRQTNGAILCFIDGNLRPASSEWLKEMLGFAIQSEIGAVGAKILDADETVRHGGIILGINDFIGYAHNGFPKDVGGNLGRAQVVNNFSATAIDCLATRRDVFEKVSGFDAENFPNRLFDVDFCLKLREKNLRVVWTPHAELVQIDGRKLLNLQKTPTAAEREFFKEKWRNLIERDPFYNPNLSRREPFMPQV